MLTQKDKYNIEDLIKNMRLYVNANFTLFDSLGILREKREKRIQFV